MEKTATTSSGESVVDPSHNEFFNTGRVGRRNAMPDILGQHCRTTTADLPDQLSALSTKDTGGGGSGGSRSISSDAEPVAGCSNTSTTDASMVSKQQQPNVTSNS